MGTNAIWNHELFDGRTGERDLITDVPGVTVGHVTLRSGGDGGDCGGVETGDGPVIRTGVTAVVPPGDCFNHKLPAAAYVSNGFGKSMGLVQIEELGSLETPILLTNTLSCGACFDALVTYSLDRHPQIGISTGTVNPVVMECNDGPINEIRAMAVTPRHGLDAIRAASSDFEEGDVGAGTGMTCFGLKGGIGSASRVVRVDGHDHVIGILVLTNFGSRECLRIAGEPIGMRLAEADAGRCGRVSGASGASGGPGGPGVWGEPDGEDKGSIVAVIATDLPADSRQLRRMAKRVTVGIARCGGYIGNGSGEIVVAFSTANRIAHWATDEPCEAEPHGETELHGEEPHGAKSCAEPCAEPDRAAPHDAVASEAAATPLIEHVTRLNENAMDRCFRAVAAASEEAIISSLLHAHGVRGRDGTVTPSLDEAAHAAGVTLPDVSSPAVSSPAVSSQAASHGV